MSDLYLQTPPASDSTRTILHTAFIINSSVEVTAMRPEGPLTPEAEGRQPQSASRMALLDRLSGCPGHTSPSTRISAKNRSMQVCGSAPPRGPPHPARRRDAAEPDLAKCRFDEAHRVASTAVRKETTERAMDMSPYRFRLTVSPETSVRKHSPRSCAIPSTAPYEVAETGSIWHLLIEDPPEPAV